MKRNEERCANVHDMEVFWRLLFASGIFFSLQEEILYALPKLVKLNPNVVKEVFNRLLFGKSMHLANLLVLCHFRVSLSQTCLVHSGLDSGQPAMTPVELLVQLHLLPIKSTEDVKCIVTGAFTAIDVFL